MESKCQDIRERLAGLVGQGQAEVEPGLLEHVAGCESCSEYLKALEADDLLMQRFAEDMGAVIAEVGKEALGSIADNFPAPKMQVRRFRITDVLPRRRLVKGAVAAAICLAAGLAIYYWGDGRLKIGPAAFGDVLERVRKAQSVRYKETFYPGESREFTSQEMITDSGIIRSEMAGGATIMDFSTGRELTVSPAMKRAVLTQRVGQPRRKGLFNYLDWISSLHEKDGKFIGQEEIDGRSVNVFVVEEEFQKKTVWVDPVTNLPVRVMEVLMTNPDKDVVVPQMSLSEGDFGGDTGISTAIMFGGGRGIQKEMTIVMSDFEWDVEFDASLFSFDIPEGYTLEQNQFDVGKSDEDDLIKALGFWTAGSDGQFPEAINDLGDPNKVKPLLKAKFDRDGSPKEEFRLALDTMNLLLKALWFAQEQKVEGQWGYGGGGARLGDAERAVCWWEKTGGGWQVIYGDLSIGDSNEAPDVWGGEQ